MLEILSLTSDKDLIRLSSSLVLLLILDKSLSSFSLLSLSLNLIS